jgi:NAD-dependent DNA ligase
VLQEGNYGDIKELYPNEEILGSSFKWSKNKVDLICENEDNVSSVIKKNMMFFKNMEMKCGLQETTLVNLYKNKGIYYLHDVLGLKLESWISVNKIGDKKAKGFLQCFKEKLHWKFVVQRATMDDPRIKKHELCYSYLLKISNASQCFGRGFAMKKIMAHYECLMEIYKMHSDVFDLSEFHNVTYIYDNNDFILKQLRLKKYKSVTEESMILFLKGCVALNVFIYNLSQNPNIMELGIKFVSAKELYGGFYTMLMEISSQNQSQGQSQTVNENVKRFVFSGFRAKDIQMKLKSCGHIVEDSITKKTNYLVVQDKTKLTTKMKKALSMNIDILNLEELQSLQLF